MANTFQSLMEFVNIAERNRKYPANTADGFRASLRLFESELNPEEKDNLELFSAHFDQIYRGICAKNPKNMSAATLEVYKRRVKGVLSDFGKYANDNAKMAAWNRPLRIVKRNAVQKKESNDNLSTEPMSGLTDKTTNMDRLELTVRDDVKAILMVPSNLTNEEAERIIKILRAHTV